jgi:transcriptional regulator with XRE-family HTH domain
MGCMLHQVKHEVNARVSCGGIPLLPYVQHNLRMEFESQRYLRTWRLYRHFTQDQVVDRLAFLDDEKLPRSKAQLSKVENGKSPYSQRLLEALAEIYDCEAWELLGRDPNKKGEVVDLLPYLNEGQLEQVAAYISGLTDGKKAG